MKSSQRVFLGLCFLFVLTVLDLGTVQAQTLINLGNLPGGTWSFANGINDSGQVVGESGLSDGYQYAFLYSGGTMINLGTLPGGNFSVAYDINDSGQIVGKATASDGYQHAFSYSAGTMTNLGTLPGGTSSVATGINDSGQIVGQATTSNGLYRGFLYSGGTMTNLGTLPGGVSSDATAINNSGKVVGSSSTTNNGPDRAFLSFSGTMNPLGTLPGGNNGYSYASDINSTGQIVGHSITYNNYDDAFLYSNGTMTDLGRLPGDNNSIANAINDSGQVVGFSFTPGVGFGHAFLYSGGTMSNLDTLYASLLVSGTTSQVGFVQLNQATAINNHGQIAGLGTYWNGTALESEAFLLTPTATPAPFSQWETQYPALTDLLANDTPENDGVATILKYLFNMNPAQSMTATDRAALPGVSIDTTTTPGTPYLSLTYRQYALETGITINVQTSTNLQSWTTVTPDISQQVGTDANTGDPIMEVGVKTNGVPKQFIRLNVTMP